jgi:hypothetical protein
LALLPISAGFQFKMIRYLRRIAAGAGTSNRPRPSLMEKLKSRSAANCGRPCRAEIGDICSTDGTNIYMTFSRAVYCARLNRSVAIRSIGFGTGRHDQF